MPTDTQIAVLCDIGQAAQFNPDKMREVVELVSRGYAERWDDGYRLTKKGQELLTERGVGLNES